MKGPLLLINFKTYVQSTGQNGLNLAKVCEKVSKEYGANIVVAPQHTDLYRIASEVDIPVYAQHIDSIEAGQNTGYVSALSITEAGARGTLLNHSEKKLSERDIELCIRLTKRYQIASVCCSADIPESMKIAKLKPDFVAYEPPQLIGTGKFSAKNDSKIIRNLVEFVRRENPDVGILYGGGVSRPSHIVDLLKLGVGGALFASIFLKSKNPRRFLEEICKAIYKI